MVSVPAQLGVPFAPGSMLGRYELLATIGAGGMASVILARQRGPAGFEKVVVIKIVHPHMAQDPAAVNMLLDEARVAAQIDHPNVVHTYELGEAYGTFYIVMEYLAGESLGQVLKEARLQGITLSPLLAGKIVADAAEGLHFAHELCDFNGQHLGIVHRDVSPGNIVVQYNGTVKVVDFGIAKAHGRVTSTQDGELKGKYGYMAPEQIKNEVMDRRSDVFSLGVVLWEALAQRRLFNADNVAATLMQVLTADRVPPSHFFPAIPHALDVACLRALAPNPDDRFASVAEMKQAIDDAVWQARIGAREVEQLMTAMFADRMQAQRQVLARATQGALSRVDLEMLGSAFRKSTIAPADLRTEYADPHAAARAPTMVPPEYLAGLPMEPPVYARPELHDLTPPMHGYPVARPQVANLPYHVAMFDRAGYAPPVAPKRVRVSMVILVAAIVVGISAAIVLKVRRPREAPAVPTVATPRTPVLDPQTPPDLATPPPPKAVVAPPVVSPLPPPVVETPIPTPVPEPAVVAVPKPVPRPRPPQDRVTNLTPRPVPTPRGNAEELVKTGSHAYMSGDFAAAETAYKQAIASNKGYAAAYRGLGFVYQRTGNTKKAIDALKTYLKLAPAAKDTAAVQNKIAQMGGS